MLSSFSCLSCCFSSHRSRCCFLQGNMEIIAQLWPQLHYPTPSILPQTGGQRLEAYNGGLTLARARPPSPSFGNLCLQPDCFILTLLFLIVIFYTSVYLGTVSGSLVVNLIKYIGCLHLHTLCFNPTLNLVLMLMAIHK